VTVGAAVTIAVVGTGFPGQHLLRVRAGVPRPGPHRGRRRSPDHPPRCPGRPVRGGPGAALRRLAGPGRAGPRRGCGADRHSRPGARRPGAALRRAGVPSPAGEARRPTSMLSWCPWAS